MATDTVDKVGETSYLKENRKLKSKEKSHIRLIMSRHSNGDKTRLLVTN